MRGQRREGRIPSDEPERRTDPLLAATAPTASQARPRNLVVRKSSGVRTREAYEITLNHNPGAIPQRKSPTDFSEEAIPWALQALLFRFPRGLTPASASGSA